ncbi:MAG: mechanosensitive ion channel domain-containing protein [Candidatus Omnitrophota bacterium]
MADLNILGLDISASIYIPVFFLVWVTVLLIIKKIIFTTVRKFTNKTKTKIDDIIIHASDLPLTLFIFVSGMFVLENIFQLGLEGDLLKWVDVTFKATTILAVIIFFDRLISGFINYYAHYIKPLRDSRGVVSIVVRGIVIGLGLLILLDSFGISITPILASLGIGSLAIALALQPTLENFFSGIQLVIDKPISVGQFIKLDSGEKGYVQKIGWRSTWIRMLPNNTVIIPNNVLVNSKVLNYYYPETEISILLQVGVHYDSDLDQVEKVTIEVAKDALNEVEGGVAEWEPFIRYHTFNDFSIDFTVVLRAREIVDGYRIKHEFIKRLHKRYNEEGIVIPYPIRTLDWNPGSGPLKVSKEG